jgi:hypothetical protein
MKKWKNNPMHVKDEVSISNMLSEELDIISGDEMNLENEGQSASKESSNTSPESECESETSIACIDGWEDVTMGDKKLNAYTFTKNAGPQFHLLPDAQPMDYFSLFFNYELLNNIVVKTNRYARHKISELQFSPKSIWSRWSDVSVPEMKVFLGVIINMGLMPEWITQIQFFGDVLYRVHFLQIFWMMHMGNNTTEESNWAIKRTKKVHRVIEYIEKQFQKYFSLYALVAPTF